MGRVGGDDDVAAGDEPRAEEPLAGQVHGAGEPQPSPREGQLGRVHRPDSGQVSPKLHLNYPIGLKLTTQ